MKKVLIVAPLIFITAFAIVAFATYFSQSMECAFDDWDCPIIIYD